MRCLELKPKYFLKTKLRYCFHSTNKYNITEKWVISKGTYMCNIF